MRYTKKFYVSSHDVDVNNHIKPSSLQRFMMEAAMNQMKDRKPTYGELFVRNQAFILTRVTIEVCRQIEQFSEIEVQTWKCPEKGVSFLRCFEVHCQGQLMARAQTVWAVANPKTGKLWKTSEVDISNFETEEELEMTLPTRFRFPKELSFTPVGVKKVHYGEVDMNMHMNNTYYVDVLWHYIPDILSKEVTSISLRYHAEAPLDEELEISMGKLPQPQKEDVNAEETYCFKSYVGDGTEKKLNIEGMIGVRKTDSWRI